MNNRSYTMLDRCKVSSAGAREIEILLRNDPRTIDVKNVEYDKEYQEKDIDLIWKFREKNGQVITRTIEIKADQQHWTKNYFLETYSNWEKRTPGCFMYTEADYLFYYFIDIKELHILSTVKVRDWFKEHIHEFNEKRTYTRNQNGKILYTTVGRTVPKERAFKELNKDGEFIKICHISNIIQPELNKISV